MTELTSGVDDGDTATTGPSLEPGPRRAVPLVATALTAIGRSRYQAVLPEDWVALQGVHGGFVAALAVRAVQAALDDPTRTLRAATFGLLRGLRPELATFHIEEIRVGRALATYHVTVTQDDGPPSMVARCHLSPPWDGTTFSDLRPPTLTPPADAVRLTTPNHVGHVHHLPTMVHPNTTMFAGAPHARWLAWTRPTEPDHIDSAWLTMLGDYFPPAVSVRNTGPSRAVTIEYGIQIHTSAPTVPLAPDEDLTCEMHTTHAAEGFAIEDGTIWTPQGTLVATTRQTRLAG
jgi:acyl-CoA thioesterase